MAPNTRGYCIIQSAMKVLSVQTGTSVSYYVNKSKRIFETHRSMELRGLEGAIIVCMDIANALVRENLAHIDSVDTSYEEVVSKVLQEPRRRAGIRILLTSIISS